MQWAEIRIEGHLDAKWAEWFEGFDFTYTKTGDTILAGCVLDQSALYGLIAKLRDLGVKLKAVNFDLFSPDELKREDTK
jgi:hypothetical protein